MEKNRDKILSENIGRFEAGNYLVTAGIWIDGFGKSYEIGIRRKSDAQFWLLQSEKYNYQSVQEVANAIAHLLSLEGESYDPEWLRFYFT